MPDTGAITIKEFCSRFGVGNTTAYEEINAGRLAAVKVGRRTLIPHEAADNWLRSLPKVREAA